MSAQFRFLSGALAGQVETFRKAYIGLGRHRDVRFDANVVQVDGYGAPGSSGSPIFDRQGHVAAVLFAGNRKSQGKIIYGIPASQVIAYLGELHPLP